ncbi:HK97 gp10 family phage protein [Nakamurella flava]|uniref:HK97 gp10 family phage protein n=1 Tax=Nakamurella flava TaxID=2576308 RepID=A0A4U6QP69_9ACTN|nr:HK97 gp10 family phage protein [Nakamurella flava]TKV61866.1 HK97 gp10 family phage protein [Nakamurella flava]
MTTPGGWDPSQLINGIKEWAGQVREAIPDAVREQAEQWLDEGNALAPKDTGALRRSGQVRVENTTAAVGWGDGLPRDYAVIQHESTGYRHPGGGGPKFAEVAGRRRAQVAGQQIADDIKSRTGG